jgi:hypothetical protein
VIDRPQVDDVLEIGEGARDFGQFLVEPHLGLALMVYYMSNAFTRTLIIQQNEAANQCLLDQRRAAHSC